MVQACRIDRERSGVETELVHHVVVRADLPLGSQVAQTVHAAGESADPRPAPGCIAVALHARDEAHLVAIAARLSHAGVRHHVVVEEDGRWMAIGVNPTRDRAAVRKVLSSLPRARDDSFTGRA